MHFIEPLESRIAPAILSGNILTYTDIDGDSVKVAFSHATMAQGDITFIGGFLPGDGTTPQSLEEVNLTGKTGGGFTLTATPHNGKGNSHADIYLINGNNTNLGTISVDGDVEGIGYGTGAVGTLGIKSFTALSMGRQLDGTNADALRNTGSFTVKGDVINEHLICTGGVKSISIGGNLAETQDTEVAMLDITGDVGSIKIGGSVLARSGGLPNIEVTGNTGSVTVGGSVIGGSADLPGESTQITLGTVSSINIGGDLVGRSGALGGGLNFESAGSVKIGGSVLAGTGAFTGEIFTNAGAGSITIGGSFVGSTGKDGAEILGFGNDGPIKIGGSFIAGTGDGSGEIFTDGNLKSLSIGHDFVGGNSIGNAAITGNGQIEAKNIGTFSIGGDFISGRVTGSGSLDSTSSEITLSTASSLKIGGSIEGNATHLAYIHVTGVSSGGGTAGIGSLSVKGSVQDASIVTGYNSSSDLVNTNASIGTISIGGDFSGSFITAGANVGTDGIAGTQDDFVVPGGTTSIGSIKIGGDITGLSESNTTFDILALKIASLKVSDVTYSHAALLAGLSFGGIGEVTVSSVT